LDKRYLDTILCGDALEIMRSMEANSVDLVVTDPPYGTGGRDGSVHLSHKSSMIGNRMSQDSQDWLNRRIAAALDRVSKDDSHCYVFSDWRRYKSVQASYETGGQWELRSLIVWDKGNGMGEYWRSSHEFILFFTKRHPKQLSTGGCFNVLKCTPVHSSKRYHPAEKPAELIKILVEASSHEGDFVLDPFVGGGTTCVVAKRLGRHYLGIDLDPEWAEQAQERI